MKSSRDFPFERARRISAGEVRAARRAIEKETGKKRVVRGRPAKPDEEKFIPTSIRLHPEVLQWAKREAKKQGCGYQTLINEVLLTKAI
ncbi:MAG: AT hook motif protein [Acidobacteria bacterium]|nr:AT hook motif protein [Acidobacteriota bacterium]